MKESYEQEEVILGIDFIRSFGQNWKEEGYIKGILHFGHKTYERKDIYMNNLFRKLFSFTFVFILLMTFCILPTIASAGTRVISQISPTHRVVLNTFKSSEATSTIGRSHLETYKNTKYTSVGVHRQYSSGSDTAWSMSVGQRAQFNDLFGIPGNYGNTAGTSRTYNLTLPAQKKISFYSYRNYEA